MPVMSVSQFITIADRLASTYEFFIHTERAVTAPPANALYQAGQAYPARLLVDLTQTGVHVLLEAKATGTTGNAIFFSVINPNLPNSVLSSLSVGTSLVISLATDSNNQSITLVEDLIQLLTTNSDFSSKINVYYPVTRTGGWVQPLSMRALSGGVGTGSLAYPSWSIVTTRPGFEGNNYTLTINQPTAVSASFSAFWDLTHLIINLPTDSSGAPTETWTQLKTDLNTVTSDFLISTNNGSGLVPALSRTLFSGGSAGSYAQVILTPLPNSRTDSADPDVALALLRDALAIDVNITAFNLEQGISYLSNLLSSLVNHFLTAKYSGGMAGFLTDHNILVHKNFSTLNNNRSSQTFNAANVFRPDQLILATVTLGGSGVVLTAGTPLGSGSGLQTETNYGPQQLLAVLVPNGGTLAADWSLSVNLTDSSNTPKTSDPISFTAGAVAGATVLITTNSVASKFYSVNTALQVSGGTAGDKIFITQVIERQISL